MHKIHFLIKIISPIVFLKNSKGMASQTVRMLSAIILAFSVVTTHAMDRSSEQSVRDSSSSARYVPEHPSELSSKWDSWLKEAEAIIVDVGVDAQSQAKAADIAYEATRAGLNSELVIALVEVLSKFDEYSTAANGIGLMSIPENVHERLGRKENTLLMGKYNLRLGCSLLRASLDQQKGNTHEAIENFLTEIGSNASIGLVWRIYQLRKQALGNFNPINFANPVSVSKFDLAGVSSEPSKNRMVKDPEKQNTTGYLKDAPQLAQSGLSTFKVSNKHGSSDAVIRIYLNGAKPAVRSMYIKRGEIFTAETLPAGNYTLRYRFIGSQDTYEAIKEFVLEEVATATGTQFSRITVTLYKVANGNMKTKKVPSDQF